MTTDAENDLPVPPSTGKRKMARKVFGNIINADHSLSFSPSPEKLPKDLSKNSQDNIQDFLATNLFPITESSGSKRREVRESGASSYTERSWDRSDSGVVVCKPFSNIIKDDEIIASPTISPPVPTTIRVKGGDISVDSKLSVSPNIRPRFSRESSLESRVKEPFDKPQPISGQLLPTSKSRKPYAKPPSGSVNPSLNAARRAKEQALKEKAKAAAIMRGQWLEEKEEAVSFNEESEILRRQQLNLQQQLSSKYSKSKAGRNQMMRESERDEIEKESLFKSQVAIEHKTKLKEEVDRRRRESLAARAKLRFNNRQGQERLRLMRIEEDQIILDERHNFSKARQEFLKENAESEKRNFQFRGGDARRIRDMHAKLEMERKEKEHENFELILAGAKDAEQYRQQLAEQRRQSLAGRNAEARRQREKAMEQNSEEQALSHESFELKRAANHDVDECKKRLERERRESLAFRNQQSRTQRKKEEEQQMEEQMKTHQRYELKFAAEKDAEAYKRAEEAKRRKSLQLRNAAARECRDKQNDQLSEMMMAEHNAWELDNAAEKDAEAYRKKLEQQRRESLAGRNEEGRRQREEQQQREANALAREHASYELKWDGEKDAEAYKRSLEEERRNSLAARNMEGRRQREAADTARGEQLAEEHSNFELKRLADKDADEYRKKLERERRESLAFRNKEGVRHAQVMDELHAIAMEQQAESFALKWDGERDAKAYLEELESQRRQSLQARNAEGRRHREIDDEIRRQETVKASQDEALRADDRKEMEQYKEKCAERDRASLEFRRKEANIQRLEERNRKERASRIEEQNFELETLARADVSNYQKQCRDNRRKSLVFRAKERRRNVQWERSEHERRIQQLIRDARLRAKDQRAIELARQRERAELTLDALRHADCGFSSMNSGR